MKIHSQRLEKYIHSKEWENSRDWLVGLYGAMTKAQRQEIKEMFERNAKLSYPQYKK